MKTRNSSGHSKRTRSRATPGRSSLANLGSLNRTSRSCGIISRTAWARSSPTRSFDARLVQREKGYPLGPLGFSSLNSTTWNSPGFAWSSPVFVNPVAIPCLPQGPMMVFHSCLVLQLPLIMPSDHTWTAIVCTEPWQLTQLQRHLDLDHLILIGSP